MILNDLYKLLIKNGYTQVYEGTLPAQPDDVIGLFLDGGKADYPWVEEPNFQVRVRSNVANNAQRTIRQIMTLLKDARDYQVETREYKGFHTVGSINTLGRDDNQRDEFTLNFRTFRVEKPEYSTALLLVEKVEENHSYDIYNMAYAYMNEYNITDYELRNRLYAIEQLEGSPEDDLLDVMTVYLDLAEGSLSRYVYTAAVNYKTVNEITDETVIARLASILQLIEDKEAQEALEEAQRQAEIEGYQTTIADKTAEIEAKALEITTLEQDIVNLNATVGVLTSEKEALELQLDEKVGDILALEAERSDLVSQLSALEATIAERDATIASLQAQITTLDADILALQATIDSQTGDITTLEAQLLDMTAQRDALQVQLDELSQPVMGVETIPVIEEYRGTRPMDNGTYSFIEYDRIPYTAVDDYKLVLAAEGFTTWEMQESPGGDITHESSSDGARIVDLIHNPYDELLEVRVTLLDADYYQAEIAALQADIDQKVIEINNLGDEITGYINQIDTLNTEIATKDGEITTLTDQVSTQQATIDALNLEVASLEQQIADLQAAGGGSSEEIDYLKTWGKFNFTETTDGMVLNGNSKDVVVPATVVYLETSEPVVEISANMFEADPIDNLTLPEGLKRIGDYAFTGCGITQATLPSTLQSIGNYAFDGNNFASIDLADGVSMGVYAFRNCKNLQSLHIPNNAVLGVGAFAYCSGLTTLTFGTGITSIPNTAFSGAGLTTITLPAGITEIGRQSFKANSLTEVILPEGVTTVDYETFALNPITTVGIPSTIATVDNSSFPSTITSAKLAAGIASMTPLIRINTYLDDAYIASGGAAGLYVKTTSTTWEYQGPVEGYGL